MGNDNNNNYIKAEIVIKEYDIGEKVRIINSFEEFKREYKIDQNEDDYKYQNENEIKKKCKIKINDKRILFSYFYKFKKAGIYNINKY